MNKRCPTFYKLLRQGLQVLLALNPGITGCITVKIHVKNGEPMLISVLEPERTQKWEEVLAE